MESTNFYSLQKEYKKLMGSITPSIDRLKDSNDAALCFIWLSKIDEIEDKIIRNEYLTRLRDNVLQNELKYPFSESPPDGPLQFQFREASTIPTEVAGVDTYPSEIEKYKEQIRNYQKKISEYRNNVLRPASKSNKLQNNGKNLHPRTSTILERPLCRCEEQGGFTERENKMETLAEINKKLTKENESLRMHNQTMEQKLHKLNSDHSRKLKSKNKSKSHFEKIEEMFRAEILSIVDKSNKTIGDLEHQLNNETMKNTSQEILATMEEKIKKLEKRYQDRLEDLFEKHKKESFEYREKIEKLQNLLISRKKASKTI